MVINERFPILSTIAKILWGIGILICIIGIVSLASESLEILQLNKPGTEWQWSTRDYLKISVGISSLIVGVISMIVAEVVGVLFAIERNTRQIS